MYIVYNEKRISHRDCVLGELLPKKSYNHI